MMFFKNAPLQSKITWVTMLTTLATLFLTVTAISILEVSEFRKSFYRELKSVAAIVGANSVAAIKFGDLAAAQNNLSVLQEDPRIIEAALYDANGQRFASYLGPNQSVTLPQQVNLLDQQQNENGLITVEVSIDYKSQIVGGLILKATTKQIAAQLFEYTTITLIISLASCLAALFISGRLRNLISGPIVELSNTAVEVSRSSNYSLRVEKQSNDETGTLVEKFNEMLRQIEATTEKLKASEDQLRLITDSLPVLIAYVDAQEHFQFTNAAYQKLLRLSSTELSGCLIESAMGGEAYHVIKPFVTQVLRGESVHFEMRMPFPAIGFRDMSVHYVPDWDGDRVRGFFSLALDISERKQAEAEREQLLQSERLARSEAERASRLKDDFLTTLSHELRTPLNAIVGWSQLLTRGVRKQEEVAEGLAVIARNAKVQTKLIEDLLDLSRIVSGKLLLEKTMVKMKEVVATAIEAVSLSAHAKDITITQHIHQEIGNVLGDHSRLQQVIWNLLVNSVKFTPKGGTIDVSLYMVDEDFLEVLVKDSGQGIPADFLPYVFERFRQGDASTTRRQGGLGIGLSLVKQLVELHGGEVGVDSDGEGRGSSFFVRLPTSGILTTRQLAKENSHSSALDLSSVTALVVDDEADACGLIKFILEKKGAQVHTAISAKEGFELLRKRRPKIVISDIGMPEHDGFELIHWIRALREDEGGQTPVVACTAFAHADDRRRTHLAGFQAHLSKPLDEAELLKTVANLIQG